MTPDIYAIGENKRLQEELLNKFYQTVAVSSLTTAT
jgi:hypothetical protein